MFLNQANMSKIFRHFKTAGAAVLVLLMVAAALPSCGKNKPCKANVKVLDNTNAPVAGATVRLDPVPCSTCTNPTIAPIQGSTDASGTISFETQLPKIMDVVVIANSTTYTTGKVVRFEEGKTDEVTVILP